MVRGIANSKIGFGDLILLLRYFFKLKVSTHPNFEVKIVVVKFLKILDVSLIAITFHLISAGFYKLFIQQAIFDNSSFLKTLSINKFHDLKVIILHVSIIVIVILFLEDIVVFGGTLANLYAGISSSLVILAIIFTCKLLDNDHHKDDE